MFAQFGKKAVYASVRPAAVHLISKNKHKINSALVNLISPMVSLVLRFLMLLRCFGK